jgi:hypothetical protein
MTRFGRSFPVPRVRARYSPTALVYPAISSVAALSSPTFTLVGPGVTLAGGVLGLPLHNPFDNGAFTATQYSLENSSFFMRFTGSMYSSVGSRQVLAGFQDAQFNDGAYAVKWSVASDGVSGNCATPFINQNNVNTFVSGSTIAFPQGASLWLRIREAAGTVYWDYAPDGVTWTNLYNTPDPLPLSVMNGGYVNIRGGFNNPSDTTTTPTVDGFNSSAAASLTTSSYASSQSLGSTTLPAALFTSAYALSQTASSNTAQTMLSPSGYGVSQSGSSTSASSTVSPTAQTVSRGLSAASVASLLAAAAQSAAQATEVIATRVYAVAAGFPVETAGAGNRTVAVTPAHAGDLIVLHGITGDSGAVATAVSGGGITWSKALGGNDGSGLSAFLWWGVAASTATFTLTATLADVAGSGVGSADVDLWVNSYTVVGAASQPTWYLASYGLAGYFNASSSTQYWPSLTAADSTSLYTGINGVYASYPGSVPTSNGVSYDPDSDGNCGAYDLTPANGVAVQPSYPFGSVVEGFSIGAMFTTTMPAAQTYPSVIVGDAPTCYWRMDDVGTTLVDQMGHDNLTATSVTDGVAGLITGSGLDTAMLFGSSSVATGSQTYNPSAMSWEAWVTLPSLAGFTGGTSSVVGCGADGDLYVASDGHVGWYGDLSSGVTAASLAGAVVAGSVYHLVGTVDNSTGFMFLYVNGTQVGFTGSGGHSVSYGAPNLQLGGNTSQSSAGPGTVLDEVAYYSAALTPVQVQRHYAAGTQMGAAFFSTNAYVAALVLAAGTTPSRISVAGYGAAQAAESTTAPTQLQPASNSVSQSSAGSTVASQVATSAFTSSQVAAPARATSLVPTAAYAASLSTSTIGAAAGVTTAASAQSQSTNLASALSLISSLAQSQTQVSAQAGAIGVLAPSSYSTSSSSSSGFTPSLVTISAYATSQVTEALSSLLLLNSSAYSSSRSTSSTSVTSTVATSAYGASQSSATTTSSSQILATAYGASQGAVMSSALTLLAAAAYSVSQVTEAVLASNVPFLASNAYTASQSGSTTSAATSTAAAAYAQSQSTTTTTVVTRLTSQASATSQSTSQTGVVGVLTALAYETAKIATLLTGVTTLSPTALSAALSGALTTAATLLSGGASYAATSSTASLTALSSVTAQSSATSQTSSLTIAATRLSPASNGTTQALETVQANAVQVLTISSSGTSQAQTNTSYPRPLAAGALALSQAGGPATAASGLAPQALTSAQAATAATAAGVLQALTYSVTSAQEAVIVSARLASAAYTAALALASGSATTSLGTSASAAGQAQSATSASSAVSATSQGASFSAGYVNVLATITPGASSRTSLTTFVLILETHLILDVDGGVINVYFEYDEPAYVEPDPLPTAATLGAVNVYFEYDEPAYVEPDPLPTAATLGAITVTWEE